MGVYEGRGALTKGLKELLNRWMEVRRDWNDANSHQFEEKYLRTWEQDLRQTVSAMDHMNVLLQQIRRDCE